MAVTDAMGGQIAMSSKRDRVSFIIAKQKIKHGVTKRLQAVSLGVKAK
jgi:hypothetical protein